MVVVEKSQDTSHYQLVAATLSQGNAWALEAPVLIAFATATHLDCRLDEGRDYAYFDVGQAVMAMQIQAQSEGLIAHVLAGYSASKLRRILKLPQEYVPLCMLAVGWPGDVGKLPENLRVSENALRSRKSLSDVAFSGSFDTPWA
jgi:nitroreductase